MLLVNISKKSPITNYGNGLKTCFFSGNQYGSVYQNQGGFYRAF